jgi:catechol 2,3-dioxygenase-like lactoylglutathione lyase family enzyme
MGTKFNMIGLFVGDLATMVTFYREVLGVEIDWNGEGPYAEFKHEGIRFAMYERSKLPDLLGHGQEAGYPNGLNGTFELAINVGSKENVDAFFKRVTQQGGTAVYAPRDEPWKMRSAMVADPEGNLIEIASDFWE